MQTAESLRPTPPRARARWRWVLSPQGIVVLVAGVASSRLGLRAISDNSALVHLRTGIDLVHTGHVPRHDPYSFTAAGHAWVVQSWLASLVYGLANAAGHHALVLLQGALMAGVGAVTAIAARSTTAWRSGLAALLAICASSPGWSPRPLLFELICLGLVLIVTTRNANPLWLVPVVWVWVNAHGSWPAGLAWIGAYAVGQAVDQRGWPRQALRYAGGFAAGLAVSMINPIGFRLIAFPFVVLHKSKEFQSIVEWRSPNFQSGNSLIALVFIAAALVILLRASTPWAHVLPVCGFLVAGLVSERNLAPLGVVLAPALAVALAQPTVRLSPNLEEIVGSLDMVGRSVAWRLCVSLAVLLVGAGLVVVCFRGPTLSLDSFPVKATDYLASTGRLTPQHRIAAVDVVGCYFIWRAPQIKVFIDDRYDMYPQAIATDANILVNARSDALGVLNQWNIDTVLWSANQALPGELEQTGGWRQVYGDGTWVVLERAPTT